MANDRIDLTALISCLYENNVEYNFLSIMHKLFHDNPVFSFTSYHKDTAIIHIFVLCMHSIACKKYINSLLHYILCSIFLRRNS